MGRIDAESTSYAHVSAAITSSTYGDTVVIPAGASTWGSTLTITKNITLQGAGIGNTVITSSIADINDALITYQPDSTSVNADGLFRVTGITLDGNDDTRGIYIFNGYYVLIENIRIDHNRFFECNSRGVYIKGMINGLADNNEFDLCYKCCDIYGEFWRSWALPLESGSEHFFYIEDNTITNCFAVTSSDAGGRYVFRYNSISTPESYDILDMHGNQAPVVEEHRNDDRGCVSAEIYENTVTNFGSGDNNGRFLAIRGGTVKVFDNTITGTHPSCLIDLREEDSVSRFGYVPNVVRNNSTFYTCKLNHTPASVNEPGVGASWATYWDAISDTSTSWLTATAYVIQDIVINDGVAYRCFLAHTSSAGDEPNIGGSYLAYWYEIDWSTIDDYKYSPGWDEVKDTYIWDNTYNAALIVPTYENDAALFIIEDRDYFLEEDLSYTPYTYPHPLQGVVDYNLINIAFTA